MEIFHTTRLDSIKRSLDRLGYKYTTNNRNGKNLILTITELPDAFKIYCINELDIPPQSDFKVLKTFFYYFFCDEDFQQLPVGEMERRLSEEGKAISRQTISKWIQFLKSKDIITDGSNSNQYLYYVSFSIEGKTYVEEIPEDKYKEAWRKYWNMKNLGYNHEACRNAMSSVNGGTVFKKPIIEENAIYQDLINNLVDLIVF